MLKILQSFLSLVRFSHTVFALPFALASASLAWHRAGFDWLQLVGILLCMVTARNVAMAFNRVADRDIDAQNPRTATRHIPSGQLSVAAVVAFILGNAAAFVASTMIFTLRENWWPLWLSGPVLAFICAYSLTKRFTALAHFWLGASLLMAPVAAWIAILGLVELQAPLLLGGAVLFWVAGFDILYACQDEEFDRKAKLHSVPAALGVAGALRVAWACHLVMLGFLTALPFSAPELGWVYYIGVGLTALLVLLQHSLVSANDLSRVNAAFFQVNAVISIGLLAVVLLDLGVTAFFKGGVGG